MQWTELGTRQSPDAAVSPGPCVGQKSALWDMPSYNTQGETHVGNTLISCNLNENLELWSNDKLKLSSSRRASPQMRTEVYPRVSRPTKAWATTRHGLNTVWRSRPLDKARWVQGNSLTNAMTQGTLSPENHMGCRHPSAFAQEWYASSQLSPNHTSTRSLAPWHVTIPNLPCSVCPVKAGRELGGRLKQLCVPIRYIAWVWSWRQFGNTCILKLEGEPNQNRTESYNVHT